MKPSTVKAIEKALAQGACVHIRPMEARLIENPITQDLHWRCQVEQRIAGEWKVSIQTDPNVNVAVIDALTKAGKNYGSNRRPDPQGGQVNQASKVPTKQGGDGGRPRKGARVVRIRKASGKGTR